jgi:hypothetical protein
MRTFVAAAICAALFCGCTDGKLNLYDPEFSGCASWKEKAAFYPDKTHSVSMDGNGPTATLRVTDASRGGATTQPGTTVFRIQVEHVWVPEWECPVPTCCFEMVIPNEQLAANKSLNLGALDAWCLSDARWFGPGQIGSGTVRVIAVSPDRIVLHISSQELNDRLQGVHVFMRQSLPKQTTFQGIAAAPGGERRTAEAVEVASSAPPQQATSPR